MPSALAIYDPQEVVFYCESRFRSILNALQLAKGEKEVWIPLSMEKELVSMIRSSNSFSHEILSQNFSLTWIGLAAACGKLINIPIVTCYLARNLIQPDEELNLAVLLNLDAGNHPSHPTGAVTEYECDWWMKDKAPDDDDLLGFASLSYCLLFHRSVNESEFKPAPTSSNAHKSSMAPEPNVNLSCGRCKLYRGVAMDALEKVRKLRLEIQHQEARSENQRLLTTRRVAGFNKLFEAAVIKETEARPPVPEISAVEATALVESLQMAVGPVPSGGLAPAPAASAGSAVAPTTSAGSAAPATSAKTRQMPVRRAAARQGHQKKPKPATPKPLTNGQLAAILQHHAEAEHNRLVQHPSLKWT